MMVWLINIDFVFISILLAFIAWQDILLRTITHRDLSFLLLLLVFLCLLQQKMPNITAALLILIVGFGMFVARIIGGGDVKLVTVLSLSMTNAELSDFLFAMAFMGGVIAVLGLLFFRTSVRKDGVPYGVAISLAYIFTYPVKPPFY